MSNIKVKYIEVESDAMVIKFEHFDEGILCNLKNNTSLRSMMIGDVHVQIYLSPISMRVLNCIKSSDNEKRIEFTLQYDPTNYGYYPNNYFIINKNGQTNKEIMDFYNKIFNNLSKLA